VAAALERAQRQIVFERPLLGRQIDPKQLLRSDGDHGDDDHRILHVVDVAPPQLDGPGGEDGQANAGEAAVPRRALVVDQEVHQGPILGLGNPRGNARRGQVRQKRMAASRPKVRGALKLA
jgi:hypothetical protein